MLRRNVASAHADRFLASRLADSTRAVTSRAATLAATACARSSRSTAKLLVFTALAAYTRLRRAERHGKGRHFAAAALAQAEAERRQAAALHASAMRTEVERAPSSRPTRTSTPSLLPPTPSLAPALARPLPPSLALARPRPPSPALARPRRPALADPPSPAPSR